MDDEEMAGREQSDSDAKTEQQIFDEQIARASGKAVVMVGGVGILLSVVLSTVALVISASHHDKTITVQAAAPASTASTPSKPPALIMQRYSGMIQRKRSCASRMRFRR